MKPHTRLLLSGVLLLALALGMASCGPGAPAGPVATTAPAETQAPATPAETQAPAAPVLEIVGPAQGLSLTMEDLLALPATQGYAGIKSSTGKITPPLVFTGVALKDLSAVVGGMDETTGFNVVAEDGYSITFSYDQIHSGTFIAYDPATGEELKSPVELTAILAYAVDGHPLDAKQDGTLRLAIISADEPGHRRALVGQVGQPVGGQEPRCRVGTEGAWGGGGGHRPRQHRVRAGRRSAMAPAGRMTRPRSGSGYRCGCWSGRWMTPSPTKGRRSMMSLVQSNYGIDVIASDGYTITLDAARVARNNNILLAYKVNGTR